MYQNPNLFASELVFRVDIFFASNLGTFSGVFSRFFHEKYLIFHTLFHTLPHTLLTFLHLSAKWTDGKSSGRVLWIFRRHPPDSAHYHLSWLCHVIHCWKDSGLSSCSWIWIQQTGCGTGEDSRFRASLSKLWVILHAQHLPSCEGLLESPDPVGARSWIWNCWPKDWWLRLDFCVSFLWKK